MLTGAPGVRLGTFAWQQGRHCSLAKAPRQRAAPPTQSQSQAASLGAHCHGSGCNTSWSRLQLACDPPPLPGLRATSRCEQTVSSPYGAHSAPTKMAGQKVGAHFCLSSQGASHSTRLPTSKAACTRAARHSSVQASHAHVGALCRRLARQACNAPPRRLVAGDRRRRPVRHATAPQQPCFAQRLPQRFAHARAGLTSQRLCKNLKKQPYTLIKSTSVRAQLGPPKLWALDYHTKPPQAASGQTSGPAAVAEELLSLVGARLKQLH